MPDQNQSPGQVLSLQRRAPIPDCFPSDRTSPFSYATLRSILRTSLLGDSMARQKQSSPDAAVSTSATASGSFFLRTKVCRPGPAPEILARPRLIERLRANLSLPVTLVTANAGSGKTTLVADFLRKQERPFVWYQLDHTDADPAVFLGYLAYGIQQQIPSFGESVLAFLQQPQDLGQQAERAADVLLNEILEGVEQQLIIVLDDYHHLGNDTPVHAVLHRLIALLPDVFLVVIISP